MQFSSYTTEQKATAAAHTSNQPCSLCRDALDESHVLYCLKHYGPDRLPTKCRECSARMKGDPRMGKMPSNASPFDYFFAKHEEGIRRYMAKKGIHHHSRIEEAKKLWNTGLPFIRAILK